MKSQRSDKRTRDAQLEGLEARGFNATYSEVTDSILVSCDQCAALCINGTATHEHGCPNTTKECSECSCQMPARPAHRTVCDACLEDERIYHGMDGDANED